jgi:polyvinyl alcohol dehydrogenase (cytochrome)
VTPNDAYKSSCGTDKQNCPDEDGPDYDFGASVITVGLPGGRELLLAGQKSGMVYALDPDKNGAIVWQTRTASVVPNVGRRSAFSGAVSVKVVVALIRMPHRPPRPWALD